MEEQDETTEDKLATELGLRFLAKVAMGGVAVNYLLGPVVVIVFLAGWWWGVRNIDEAA